MSQQMLQNFIDGQYVATDGAAHHEITDPVSGEAYMTVPESDGDAVDYAMRCAERAFPAWSQTTPMERQRALLRIADAIEANLDDLVAAELRQTGSRAAAGEVSLAADQLRFAAGACRILEGRAAGEYADGHTSYTRREPVGVCAQFSPWNYPMMMAALKSAPALAAGNTVVIKPSPTTSVTTLMYAEIARDFLPPGVLNVLCGGSKTGRLMTDHPVPSMVSVTGSVATGVDIAMTAASTLKRVHLELGGKTPVIVCADADVRGAARKTALGAFANAGQDCTAASRVLVSEEVYTEFVSALLAETAAIKPGSPADDGAYYGPLNNSGQMERVSGLVQRAPRHAKVLTGGGQVGSAGYFFAPTVIDGLRVDDELSQTEIFGPVITIEKFESDEKAIQSANAVSYGLASSVWTESGARAMRMSRELDFGCVWVNTHLMFPSEMPHGGFKHSGYGKDLSLYSLEDYTRIKHVMHAWS